MADVVEAVRCSALARSDEPLPGTAPEAPAWLLVEDPGPWGRDALHDGSLPESVIDHLADGVATHGVRYQALRRPDRSTRERRAVFLANVAAGWLARFDLPVETLADLDVAAATAAAPPPAAMVVDQPLVLVCTHSRRDACCALRGRPMVAAMAARAPEQVWETSHTSGHRFAPSILTFPTGGVYGFVDDGHALLDDVLAGRLHLDRYRGDPALRRPAQAAEVAVRRAHGLADPAAVRTVTVHREGSVVTVVVETVVGTETVVVEEVDLPPAPVSCNGQPAPRSTWTVRT